MNRSLKLSMLVALALGTSHAFAMELGQVQVKSALGQPLLAEIPLNAATQAEMKNLSVKLASSEEFARAGIVGGRTSIPLHFSVANTGSGHSVIRITSSVPVDDPYLDLLIEVKGGAGKSVREFAILLDPPNAGAPAAPAAPTAPVAPVAPMPSSPQQQLARRTAPVPTRSPVAAPVAAPLPPRSAAQRRGSVANGKYGPVERGQTLSGVAGNVAPAGVDVRQMMLALQQANPDAFYRQNINALKSGAVLRVPTAAEAQAMTVAAAMAEVRRQNGDWRTGTPGKPSVVADAATRTPTSGASGRASDNGDRLALVPAKDGGNDAGAAGGNASNKSDKAANGTRQDLMRAKESVVSLQQQSADLKSRLKDLSDINSKNERLLSLKDNEIAELQTKLATARKTAGLAAPAAVAPTPAASTATIPSVAPAVAGGDLETATASSTAMAEESPASSISAALAGAAMASSASAPTAMEPATSLSANTAEPDTAAPAVAKPTKPSVISEAKAPPRVVEQPWYMQTWAWAAGGVAVVVLILLAMLGRRRKGPAGSASSKVSVADRFGSAAARDSHPLAEEDIDQEELLDQLAEHPDDIGLHLELVTLYYSRRNVEYFEAAAEAMYAHVTDPGQDEWQDVMHMGEDLAPEHPLFDHHPALPVSDEDEARREFDIDDYADDHDVLAEESSPTVPPQIGARKVSEYNFNFDLTRPHAEEPSVDSTGPADDVTVFAPLVSDESETVATIDPESSWQFDDAATPPAVEQGVELGDFSDDAIDTKLDLARAYLDMGDADGARAMLGEVVKEGTQMQRDTAKRLLDSMS